MRWRQINALTSPREKLC